MQTKAMSTCTYKSLPSYQSLGLRDGKAMCDVVYIPHAGAANVTDDRELIYAAGQHPDSRARVHSTGTFLLLKTFQIMKTPPALSGGRLLTSLCQHTFGQREKTQGGGVNRYVGILPRVHLRAPCAAPGPGVWFGGVGLPCVAVGRPSAASDDPGVPPRQFGRRWVDRWAFFQQPLCRCQGASRGSR